MMIAGEPGRTCNGKTDFEVGVLDDDVSDFAMRTLARRYALLMVQAHSDGLCDRLAPIEWLAERAQGTALTVDQAIEVDNILLRFHGRGEPLKTFMAAMIEGLEARIPAVANLLSDWRDIEEVGHASARPEFSRASTLEMAESCAA